MFKLDGLGNIRKVRWTGLRPGVVILSGVSINDHPIPELTGFPVLTESLISDLSSRYQFLAGREVVVAEAVYNYSPFEFADQLRHSEKQRNSFNRLRRDFEETKKMVLLNMGLDLQTDVPVIGSDHVDREYMVKDTYNSFSYLYGLGEDLDAIPSFFHRMDLSLSLADLVTNRLQEKFNVPDDSEVVLHLVVDFSRSMDSMGKLDLVVQTVNAFYSFYSELLANTTIKLYTFSDECRPARYPLQEAGVRRGNTAYGSFMKKVLHLKEKEKRNKIILFTDGVPTDRSEALKMAELIKKNCLDYTQIIFDIKEERRTEVVYADGMVVDAVDNMVEELSAGMSERVLSDEDLDAKMKGIFDDFTEVAESCGGNQIILKINELLNLVTVECYDRYLGLLSLATRAETVQVEETRTDKPQVKKWSPPRV